MTNDFQVFIDSDAFIGSLYPEDAHHLEAVNVFNQLESASTSLVTSNFVVSETATVLSHRSGQTLARQFLKVINNGNTPIIHIDEQLQQAAYRIFEQQTKKGSSITDCANVAVIHQFEIPTIFSFDQVYPRKFGLTLASH